jgi:tetratricopeptide (TPR) repeat protein
MVMNMPNKKWTAFALLFFIILLIYSNTFGASWHLDDYPTILKNKRIKLNELQPESIVQTFFASRDGGLYLGKKLYRPISCLTLALNWHFGKDDVTGYHMVNLSIHFLTAFILFLTVFNLLRTPNLSGRFEGSEYFIALLTAIIWAINPIHTQAVTYIVQRMASLAALFYIVSIYFYLMGRLSKSAPNRIFFFAGCVISFLFALGSKENAATLPVALLLLEYLFFKRLRLQMANKSLRWGIVMFCLSVVIVGLLLLYHGKFSGLLAGYNARSFTPVQRLMTEPRVIIFYLSQIFYPLPSRLSIAHDLAVSTSLYDPWTTLPSIIITVGLIGFGLTQTRKRPILAFAILFFFLNHLIESTIFPLELIFEHRNYLPSLFLFIPISTGVKWLFDHYREKKRSMYVIFAACLPMLIIGVSLGTYIRNMAWNTEKTLWEDAMAKAPGRARPYHNLAWGHYEKTGNFQKAYNLYEMSLGRESDQPVYSQILALSNMAGILNRQGKFDEAVGLCKKALDIYPHYMPALRVMTYAFLHLKNWPEALKSAEVLHSKNYLNKDYKILFGFALLKSGRYEKALSHFRDTLRRFPNEKRILYNIGVTLSLLRHYDRAEFFLNLAKQMSSNNILISFYLIENSIRAGNHSAAEQYLEQLFASHSIQKIVKASNGVSDDVLIVTFSPDVVAALIAEKLREKNNEIIELGNSRLSIVKNEGNLN